MAINKAYIQFHHGNSCEQNKNEVNLVSTIQRYDSECRRCGYTVLWYYSNEIVIGIDTRYR
jgi:hypothetical protein